MPGGVQRKSPSEYKPHAEKNQEAFRRFASKTLPMERRRTPSRTTVRRSFYSNIKRELDSHAEIGHT